MNNLKVSVITVCRNSAQYIKTAIDSVLNQTYKNIEYIIVDGNSTDGTKEIIHSYGKKIDKFISEPDNGIYDAMNKGIKLATGDIIAILNSDDIYSHNNVLLNVVNAFKEQCCDIVYANIQFTKSNDLKRVVREWKTSAFIPGSFKKGWHPPHPAFFVKRGLYQKYGDFNTSLKLAADFELMLRLLERQKAKSYYLQEFLIKMRIGGASTSLRNLIKQNRECYKAFKMNKIKVSPFYLLNRLIPKIFQHFNTKEIKTV